MKPAVLLLLTVWILQAGAIRVVVRDPSGALIPNATVRAGVETRRTSATGEALFDDLAQGRVNLSIEAAGFTPWGTTINVKTGRISVERTLSIARRTDEVNVGVDPREDRTNPLAFGFTTLTGKELDLLPDDQDQFEEVLRNLAGPGAVFRVDGFRGGRLPPKDQIQSIRFRLTPYSAEEHDDGFMIVDITTKPGLGEWHGNLSFAFGDDSLNARNAFAPRREPQQSRRLDVSLLGPLVKNKTSLSMNFTRNDGYDSRTSIGVLPEGPFANLIRLPQLFTNGGFRVNHGLSRRTLLRADYQYERQERNSIGPFDLPERMASSFNQSHQLRLSAQTSISERMVNELRVQHQWVSNGAGSGTEAPAIIVQGAFARGGANQDSNRRGRTLEVTDHLNFNKRKHGLKTGFQLDAFQYRGRDFANGFGVTTYSNLAAFAANRPALISLRSADVAVDYSQLRGAAYFNDDIRVRRNLSLTLGLRMEGMSQIKDRWNLSPRAGFAWSPFKHGKTTLRGGGGVFYNWYDASLYEQILRLNGASQVDLITSPLGASLPGFLRAAPSLSLPYTLRWSFGMQQQLPYRINLMADYRHERGLHQFRGLNVNQPGSGYGYLLELDSAARSRMNALMMGLSSMPMPDAKGWRARIFWGAHLFVARARDEISGPLVPPADSRFARADYGPSNNDLRRRFSMMLQGTLARGFQIGTFLSTTSAPPYNITTGLDTNGDTFFNERPDGVSRNSARGAGVLQLSTRLAWSNGFGERKAEGGAGPVTVRLRMDGSGGMPDLPSFGGRERKNPLVRLQLYAMAANVVNHANAAGFAGVITSPFFGQPTMAMSPRRIEIGTRLSF